MRKNWRRKSAKQTKVLSEAAWNKETRKLKKLARLLFYDIQKLESLWCLDLKKEINLFDEVRSFEINLIKTALLQTGGSQQRSASLLGISTSNLNNKIKRYGILPKRSGADNTI